MTEPQKSEREPKRVRTCIGCGERVALADDEGDLVGLVLGPEGEVAIDARERPGRGAHVHARRACLEKAAKSGLARAFKGQARRVSADELAAQIVAAMDRRLEGFTAAALRTRHIAYGSDSVTAACRDGSATLVVVARDAAAAADLTEVRRAIAEGWAVAWGTRERLGQLLKPADPGRLIAVFAITSPQIGGAFRTTARVAAQVEEGWVYKGDASVGDGATQGSESDPSASKTGSASGPLASKTGSASGPLDSTTGSATSSPLGSEAAAAACVVMERGA